MKCVIIILTPIVVVKLKKKIHDMVTPDPLVTHKETYCYFSYNMLQAIKIL